MELNITLAEALERASEGLRKKMLHSVELLQKAEKIDSKDWIGNSASIFKALGWHPCLCKVLSK